ncbi:hypothetical protein GCM10010363_61130 [Streptomyces omiyaensis]|uniref:sigma-70 region 4 domain-containing protein n=1 Tax=Streptomyces omiyaensis TaxID=68247 RepID=UPI00167A6680|nr:sigma-70 region 4 domain-containing protein [Streptomyces omiyaensis]GGY71536.1 hypothetical protein GCM10010363_61130 [Streptomyces omiyaensis]
MSDYRDLIARAEQRIDHGTRERSAGADDKARAIAGEAARRGRGGPKAIATELGVSEKTVSQAISRARKAAAPDRSLPHDTLERLLSAELPGLPPLPASHWQTLAYVLNGTVIDLTWIESPHLLLAGEVDDLDDEYEGVPALAAACRALTRVQALAVIDALLRGDLAALPTKD